MGQRGPLLRDCLSTLLLIVIAGLTSELLVEQRRRWQVERELAVTRAQLPRYTVDWAQLRTAIENSQKGLRTVLFPFTAEGLVDFSSQGARVNGKLTNKGST
jgi:hypothetical protein